MSKSLNRKFVYNTGFLQSRSYEYPLGRPCRSRPEGVDGNIHTNWLAHKRCDVCVCEKARLNSEQSTHSISSLQNIMRKRIPAPATRGAKPDEPCLRPAPLLRPRRVSSPPTSTPPPHSLLSGHSLALGLEAMLVCHDAQELLLVDLAVAVDVGLVRFGLW